MATRERWGITASAVGVGVILLVTAPFHDVQLWAIPVAMVLHAAAICLFLYVETKSRRG